MLRGNQLRITAAFDASSQPSALAIAVEAARELELASSATARRSSTVLWRQVHVAAPVDLDRYYCDPELFRIDTARYHLNGSRII